MREQFNPEEIVADLCIMYEATGFKHESAESDFWDQYMDFAELGDDANLIKNSKMDDRALTKEQRQRYTNMMSPKVGGSTS